MEVDTGASLSLMSQATLSSVWPETQLKSSTAKLPTYTGKEVTVKGAGDIRVKYRGQTKDLTLTIVDGDGLTLMGRDWLQHLKLDWATLNHTSEADCSEFKSMLNTHAALFSQGLGCTKGTTARLYLKERSQPRFFRARQILYALSDKVTNEIDRQVGLGILEPVKFSPWATPVVPILKNDGSICLYKDSKITVNRKTVTETYPCPGWRTCWHHSPWDSIL